MLANEQQTRAPHTGLYIAPNGCRPRSTLDFCAWQANEKLQQFFLKCVFKSEQDLYHQEGVRFPDISYQDNQGCIDCIEKYPHGVFRLLDNQCKQPVPTEGAFFEAVNRMHAGSEFFRPAIRYKKRETEAFVINHFAGACCYDREELQGSWLEKNNDLLASELEDALGASNAPLIAALFGGPALSVDGSGNPAQRISIGSGAKASLSFQKRKPGSMFASISRRLCLDLNSLLSELAETKAHFIRCIKPNTMSVPMSFEAAKVLEQLRSSGVFDAVELMKAAFPTKIRFDDIYGRYASLLPKELVGSISAAGFCEVVALACDVERTDYAVGFTQLFLRAGKGVFLEELVSMDVAQVVPLLEEKIREYERRKKAALVLGLRVVTFYRSKVFQRKRMSCLMIQRIYRGAFARKQARKALKLARKNWKAAAAAPGGEGSVPVPPRSHGGEPAAKAIPDAAVSSELKQELAAMKLCNSELQEQVATLTAQNTELVAAAAGGNDLVKQLLSEAQKQVASLRMKLLVAKEQLEKERMKSAELRDELDVASNQSVLGSPQSSAPSTRSSSTKGTSKFNVNDPTVLEHHFKINIERDDVSGTLGVDIDLWHNRVTVAIIDPNVPAFGKLMVGDEIVGVGGVHCQGDLSKALKCIIDSPSVVSLDICRRPPVALLRNELQMKTARGEWNFVMATLQDTRQLMYELPDGMGAQLDEPNKNSSAVEGEVNLHHISKLEMVDGGDDGLATLTILLSSGVLYQLRYVPSSEEGVASGTAVLRTWQDQLSKLLSRTEQAHKKQALVWQQGAYCALPPFPVALLHTLP